MPTTSAAGDGEGGEAGEPGDAAGAVDRVLLASPRSFFATTRARGAEHLLDVDAGVAASDVFGALAPTRPSGADLVTAPTH